MEAQQVLTGLGLDPRRQTVALCPRKLIAGLWHPFSAETIEKLVVEFARLVSELQAAGVQVVLVQMSPDQPDDDAVVIDEIIARLDVDRPRPAVLAWRPELPRLMIDVFTQIDAVVAVRLHGAILAMLAGKPAMTIAYEPKVRGIMEAVGLSEHVLPVEGFDGRRCAEAVLGWLENRDEVGRRIDASMEQIRARTWHNLSDAVRLIAGPSAGPPMRHQPGVGADGVAS
jgi:polysaccharide pyruvyl transferase WcaK-like protein